MLNIVLIRPGATDFDLQGRIQGTLDLPLSEEGRHEVQQSIEPLKSQNMQVIYCAPGEASEQSAKILGEALDVKVKVLDHLHNLDHGLWQGMLIEDVKTKQPKVYRQWQEHPDIVCPPGGEMLEAARQRVSKALTKIIKKNKNSVVGLVAPEPLASLVRCMLRDDVPCELWKEHACGTWEIISTNSGASVS